MWLGCVPLFLVGLHDFSVDRQDGRDAMLIDQLRHCAFHSNDLIVEKFHLSLQPDAIHQKNGYQRLALSKVLQELVLQNM